MAPGIATLAGRDIPIIEVPTMDKLFASVGCQQMQDAARVAGGPQGCVYVGGSRDLRCAKATVYTHTYKYT